MVATLLVYAPAVRNGFVWDDTALVLRDPLIRSWRLIPEGFRHFLFVDATASNFYRPIQRLVFTGNYAAFAFNPAGWHAVSVVVHGAAAIALYFMLRQWWGKERHLWALGVALVWAIHPLHTSAVTYVSGLADPLAALFGFTAIAFGWRSLAGNRAAPYIAGLCFLLAILSKESGAMAICIWLAMLGWQRVNRATWIRWLAITAVIFGAYLALRTTGFKTPPPVPTASTHPVPAPVLAARALGEYAGLVVAPVHLHMERNITPKPDGSDGPMLTIAGTIIALALLATLWWSRRRHPQATLALLGAGIAYFPISNVLRLNATAAEHWLYVSSAYLFAAVALITLELTQNRPLRTALYAGVGVWSLWLATLTWQRQADWKDQRTFLTRTIEEGGDTARMHLNLATLELGEGHSDAALAQYQRALEFEGRKDFMWLALATAQLRLKNAAVARESLSRCEGSDFLKAEIIQLEAMIDQFEQKVDPTPRYLVAANLRPLNWGFRRLYFTSLAESNLSQAMVELRAFLGEQEFRADSWKLLGDFLRRANQTPAAAAAYTEATERDVHLKLKVGP